MKVTPQHLAALREAVQPLDTPERRKVYTSGEFPRADRVSDLDMRYRWDLFWASKVNHNRALWDAVTYNDAHIDTALKVIVPPLDRGDQASGGLASTLTYQWKLLDDAPLPGGQVGGDEAGDSVGVRYGKRNPDGTYSLITSNFYSMRDDLGHFVQNQTEFVVCADPEAPGDTEVWADYRYEDFSDSFPGGDRLTEAEADVAAANFATGQMSVPFEDLYDWNGTDALPSKPPARSALIPAVTDRVAWAEGSVVKFTYRDGKPVSAQLYDPDTYKWGDPRTTSYGVGATLLSSAAVTPASDRKVPAGVVKEYAERHGVCMLCGRELRNAASRARGYGSSCVGKVR